MAFDIKRQGLQRRKARIPEGETVAANPFARQRPHGRAVTTVATEAGDTGLVLGGTRQAGKHVPTGLKGQPAALEPMGPAEPSRQTSFTEADISPGARQRAQTAEVTPLQKRLESLRSATQTYKDIRGERKVDRLRRSAIALSNIDTGQARGLRQQFTSQADRLAAEGLESEKLRSEEAVAGGKAATDLAAAQADFAFKRAGLGLRQQTEQRAQRTAVDKSIDTMLTSIGLEQGTPEYKQANTYVQQRLSALSPDVAATVTAGDIDKIVREKQALDKITGSGRESGPAFIKWMKSFIFNAGATPRGQIGVGGMFQGTGRDLGMTGVSKDNLVFQLPNGTSVEIDRNDLSASEKQTLAESDPRLAQVFERTGLRGR